MQPGRPPKVLVELALPSDLRLLKGLQDIGLDAVFLPDNPMGRVGIDPLVAAVYLKEDYGLRVYAAVALGSKSRAYAASRLVTAHFFGVDGIVLVAGDDSSCGERMRVVEAIRYARGAGELSGLRYASGLSLDAARQHSRAATMIGAVTDLLDDKSYQYAFKKVDAGADFLLTQLMRDPRSAYTRIVALADRTYIYVGLPYVTFSPSSSVRKLLGGSPPRSEELLASFKKLVEETNNSRIHAYVSPIGSREGLTGFLYKLVEIID